MAPGRLDVVDKAASTTWSMPVTFSIEPWRDTHLSLSV